MALVPVVQDRLFAFAEEMLPDHTDRNDRRAEVPADASVRIRNGLLRLRRELPGPSHVEDGLRGRERDSFVEESKSRRFSCIRLAFLIGSVLCCWRMT